MTSMNGKRTGDGKAERIPDILLRFVGDPEKVTGWFVLGGIYNGHLAKPGIDGKRPWAVYLSEEVEDDPGYFIFPQSWFEEVKEDV